MKIGHIEVFVGDVKESLAFYNGILGFEVTAVQGDRHAWIKSGEIEILLRSDHKPERKRVSGYDKAICGIVLYTDDLEAEMEALRMRGLEFRGNDGSDNCPTFHDPDGNWFQLVNPEEH